MNKKSIALFLTFLFLILINFIVGLLVANYGIVFINFIAFRLFNEIDLYVYRNTGAIFGLYMSHLINIAFWSLFMYSIFCYYLYIKYQDTKFFLIIFVIFVAYCVIFCLVFSSYRLVSLLLHFTTFWLMYIEIILLYRIKSKARVNDCEQQCNDSKRCKLG